VTGAGWIVLAGMSLLLEVDRRFSRTGIENVRNHGVKPIVPG